MEEASKHTWLKYQDLIEACQRKVWKAHCEPIEVECRGFAARSL